MRVAEKLYPFVLMPEEVADKWEWLEPYMEAAVVHSQDTLTVSGLRQLLVESKACCMGVARGDQFELVIVVQATGYLTHRAATVIAAAGRGISAAQDFSYILDEWAANMGCTQIEAYCRPAMVRLLRRFGFLPKFTVVSRSLRRLQ